MHCGLDFGTSNSALGVVVDGVARLVPVEGDEVTVPSAIFYDGRGGMDVGRRAIERYVKGEPGRLMRSMKSILGTRLMDEATQVGAEAKSLRGVVTEYLAEVKRRAEARLDVEIDRVVQGRPVFFTDLDPEANERAERVLAGILSSVGFREIEFELEPIAAASHFETEVDHEALAMIADVGGGTSDFSVVRIVPAGAPGRASRNERVLACHGVRVGGTDFDQRLSLACVMPLLGHGAILPGSRLPSPAWIYVDLATPSRIAMLQTRKYVDDIREIVRGARGDTRFERLGTVMSERLGHRMAVDVERLKIALSEAARAGVTLDYVEPGLIVEATRAELAAAIEERLEAMRESIAQCLKLAGLSPDAIELSVLTGGSTEMPLVREAVAATLPRANMVTCDRFGAVGTGLAVEAESRFGRG